MAPAAVQKKTVLITGCSTGSIGWAMTKVFLEHDFHVFAGIRDSAKAQDLAELSSVDLVELDVTIAEAISKSKQLVAERTGGKLDVLVSSSTQFCWLSTVPQLEQASASQACSLC